MPKASCALCRTVWAGVKISRFQAPKDEERRKKWSEAGGVELRLLARVCELHFDKDDFIMEPDAQRKRLKREALPMRVEYLATWNAPAPPFNFPPPNSSSSPESSTPPDDSTQFDYGSPQENLNAKAKIESLEAQVASLQEECKELQAINNNLTTIFTENQIRKFRDPSKNVHWTYKDFAWAVPLHAASPVAYNHLYNKGLPLPSESTLARWLRRRKPHDGILHFVVNDMRVASRAMEVSDRICVIAFDEIEVVPTFEDDPLSNTASKPDKYVQMAIAQGLKRSWRQPIFHAVDCKMSKSVLENIITELENSGYPVIGIVSDMGSSNETLCKELDVTAEKNWFFSPNGNGGKVFVFSEVPSWAKFKTIRNSCIPHYSRNKPYSCILK